MGESHDNEDQGGPNTTEDFPGDEEGDLYVRGTAVNEWSAEEVAEFMERVETATDGGVGESESKIYTFDLLGREVLVRIR